MMALNLPAGGEATAANVNLSAAISAPNHAVSALWNGVVRTPGLADGCGLWTLRALNTALLE